MHEDCSHLSPYSPVVAVLSKNNAHAASWNKALNTSLLTSRPTSVGNDCSKAG